MLPLPPSDPSSPDKYLRDFEPEESRSEHSRRPISRIGENSTDWKKRKEGKKEEEETKITRTVFVPYARVVTRLGRVYVSSFREFRVVRFYLLEFYMEREMETKKKFLTESSLGFG